MVTGREISCRPLALGALRARRQVFLSPPNGWQAQGFFQYSPAEQVQAARKSRHRVHDAGAGSAQRANNSASSDSIFVIDPSGWTDSLSALVRKYFWS